MNTSVKIVENFFEPDKVKQHRGKDVISILQKHFETFPESARLYNGYVSLETDVTPQCEEDIARLRNEPGDYIVVVYPAAAIPALVWYVAAAVAFSVLVMTLLKPPAVAARNVQNESSNNSLSNRTNEARPRARIPDIFGTVRAYPDLVQLPYSFWVDNTQVETTMMVIGRGTYEIHDMKESDTLVSEIPGSKVSVWDPDKDVKVDAPNYEYGPGNHDGDYIWDTYGLGVVKRVNSVDGQTLEAPNNASFIGDGNLVFYPDGKIEAKTGLVSVPKFSDLFKVGEFLNVTGVTEKMNTFTSSTRLLMGGRVEVFLDTLSMAIQPGQKLTFTPSTFNVLGDPFDFSGTYTVDSLAPDYTHNLLEIYLDHPELVNPNWNTFTPITRPQSEYNQCTLTYGNPTGTYDYLNGVYPITAVTDRTMNVTTATWGAAPVAGTAPLSGTMYTSSGNTEGGPFTVLGTGVRGFALNFFAQQLYKDNGENQVAASVTLEATVTAYDPLNEPITSVTKQVTVQGNATDKKSKGATLYIDVPEADHFRVIARRVTPKDTTFKGQVIDEIKWRDLYSIQPYLITNFGNVTMARVTSRATESALSAKERKLNCRVTRKINIRLPDGNFSPDLHPTNYIADILRFACLDPWIGNRQEYELDIPNIYTQVLLARTYFGFDQMMEFCYTFDQTGMSFEDTVQAIAGAGLLTAYRQGQVIKLELERKGAPAKLLFNHRNKIPGSEKRSYEFKNQNQFDGVQYTYIDPVDDSVQTLYIPGDLTIKPRKIESIGIRNMQQAHIHGWREWNKLRFRHLTVEFDGLSESETVIPPQCILVTDNTRNKTIDGYVVKQVGLMLTLSQIATFEAGKDYSIQLQMSDGSIESIVITPQGATTDQVLLATPTIKPIITDLDYVVQTGYTITESTATQAEKMLLTERGGGDSTSNTYPIVAINYDDRYYGNDKDFNEGNEGPWLESIGDLILWLDASDFNTIVTSSGLVSQWVDKSSVGNHAFQTRPDIRPDVETVVFAPRSVSFIDE